MANVEFDPDWQSIDSITQMYQMVQEGFRKKGKTFDVPLEVFKLTLPKSFQDLPDEYSQIDVRITPDGEIKEEYNGEVRTTKLPEQ